MSRELEGLGDDGLSERGLSSGMVGRTAVGKTGRVVDTIEPREGECFNFDCLPIWGRFLEESFRNFQTTFQLPAHVQPPFRHKKIALGRTVTIPGGAYGPSGFVSVVCYRVDMNWRGALMSFGQGLESLAAFDDVEWRITVSGQPVDPYTGIRFQLYPIVTPQALMAPIHLRQQNEICLEARSLSALDHEATGILCGWTWFPRSYVGDEHHTKIAD